MPASLISPGYLFNTDPVCRVIGDRLWVFCAQDQYTIRFPVPEDSWNNVGSVHSFSTADLRTWVHHGTAFSSRDAAWPSLHSLWPGDCGVPGEDGRFYAYPSFRNQPFEIGVMVADHPQGPYHDALGRPLINDAILADHGLDVHSLDRYGHLNAICVHDEAGVPWLVFGHFHLFRIRLNGSMTALEGPAIPLDVPYRGGEAIEYIENPRIVRKGARFLLIYTAYKNWQGVNNPFYGPEDPEGPYIQYCLADSIWGPYASPRHLIFPPSPSACNITASLVDFNGRTLAVFHVPFQDSEHRQTGFAEVHWDAEGNPRALHPDTDPPLLPPNETRLLLDAFAPARFAVDCHGAHRAAPERGVGQFHHMKMHGGGWLCFHAVDFGRGASAIELSAGSERMRLLRGEVEFRRDAPDGPLLGTLPVEKSFQHDFYRLTRGPCHPVGGIHDLYLVARGCESPISTSSPLFQRIDPAALSPSEGPLFNIDWFRFVPTE